MANQTTRREILKASAVAALSSGVFGAVSAFGVTAPGANLNRVRCAVIGVAGRGSAHVSAARRLGEIVALCDIDTEKLAKVSVENPRAMTFVDFRQMLDLAGDQIDAVFVATPDHTHAPAAAMAMKMGKAVYCEKPLTRTVYEARRLKELAKKHGVVTQMGNHGTASTNLRKVAKLLREGAFGQVKEAHVWTNRAGGWWPQGVDRPASKPQPKTVAWDEWIGPSPFRDYADGYHAFAWRGWWDFGSGALGDIGCHAMNLPFMGLDLRDPLAITAKTSGHNKDSFPSWSEVTYEFGKRGKRDALNMTWYDGGRLPSKDLAPGVDYGGNGSLLVCEKATLFNPAEYGMSTQILGGMAMPETSVIESPGHFDEFIVAVEGGRMPESNFDYSAALTETVVLGNLAVWASGERVEWDAANMKAKGRPDLDVLLQPQYRPGWEI